MTNEHVEKYRGNGVANRGQFGRKFLSADVSLKDRRVESISPELTSFWRVEVDHYEPKPFTSEDGMVSLTADLPVDFDRFEELKKAPLNSWGTEQEILGALSDDNHKILDWYNDAAERYNDVPDVGWINDPGDQCVIQICEDDADHGSCEVSSVTIGMLDGDRDWLGCPDEDSAPASWGEPRRVEVVEEESWGVPAWLEAEYVMDEGLRFKVRSSYNPK